MLDSGACASAANRTVFQHAYEKGVKITPVRKRFGLAQGVAESNRQMIVDVKFLGNLNGFKQMFVNFDDLLQDLVLGRDFLCKAKMQISVFDNGYSCGRSDIHQFSFASVPRNTARDENEWSCELTQFTQKPPEHNDKMKKFGIYADDSIIISESIKSHVKHM
jgi:hypothetical protein